MALPVLDIPPVPAYSQPDYLPVKTVHPVGEIITKADILDLSAGRLEQDAPVNTESLVPPLCLLCKYLITDDEGSPSCKMKVPFSRCARSFREAPEEARLKDICSPMLLRSEP